MMYFNAIFLKLNCNENNLCFDSNKFKKIFHDLKLITLLFFI